MAKVKTTDNGKVGFICVGCGHRHYIPFGGNGWSFNGDKENPTIKPSILMRTRDESGDVVCHSFVTDGSIQFLGDCTHKLAGQTVPMPEYD